jgi:hypothetical protein
MEPNIRNSRLDTLALSFEDRLKLTPAFALNGGVRPEVITLARDGFKGYRSPKRGRRSPTGQPTPTNRYPT